MSKAKRHQYEFTTPSGEAIRYKVRSRPTTAGDRQKYRLFWFQIIRTDGSFELIRKSLNWHGATAYGDLLAAKTKDLDVLFLIDGNVPVEAFGTSERPEPIGTPAIWNRWELHSFTECGKPCVVVNVQAELMTRLMGATA